MSIFVKTLIAVGVVVIICGTILIMLKGKQKTNETRVAV